jgi:hypothetical protein
MLVSLLISLLMLMFRMKPLTEANPVVSGSSTYSGGGRNLKRGVGFQFFGCLELLVRMPVAVFYGLLAQRDCRDADRSQPLCPLAPAADDRGTASSYHILGYLGQRDEPSLTRREVMLAVLRNR